MIKGKLFRVHLCVQSVGVIMFIEMAVNKASETQKLRASLQPFLVPVALCEHSKASQESGERRQHPIRSISWTSAVLCFEKAKISEHDKEPFPNLHLPPELQVSTLPNEQMSSRKAGSLVSMLSSVRSREPSAGGANRAERWEEIFTWAVPLCLLL